MLNKVGTQEIETKRLILRRMKISDSEDMFNNWASDPCVSEFYSWKPHKNILETEQIIKTWVAQYKDPLCFHWIIIDKETQKAIGTFYINHIDENNCTGTINCILARQVWGKGLATEITQSVISYCFEKINFKKIFSHHHENNIGSGKALVKAGFHFTDKRYHEYEDNWGINGNYLHYVIENRLMSDNPIAAGNTAEIFDVGDGKVLKLFKKGYSQGTVENEYSASRMAVSCGKYVPEIYEMIENNGRYGYYMERIYGESLLEMVMTGKIDPKSFMSLFTECHEKWLKNTSEELVSYKEWMINDISGKENSSELIAKIRELPDGKVICHGDFHPGNIIVSDDGTPVIIDFANICKGPKEYDIARTYCLLKEATAGQPIADMYLVGMQRTLEEIALYVEIIKKFRQYEMGRV